MLRYDKVLFREARVLRASLATLDTAWTAVCEAAPDPATRELAAMVAAARWTLTAALARGESRGIHQRTDFPAENPALARRIRVRGLDPPVAEPEALQAEQPA